MQELEVRSSLWLTATLPLDARLELRALLDPLRELGAFDLPRLDLRCVRVPWSERADALVGWLLQQRGPGILFVPTRESALRVARLIAAAGVEAVFYHAGMGAEERRAVEALLERRMPAVVVATSAFGMGMHYPALQWAALWQAPPSLLALAQSVGRVGRGADLTARALVFWDEDDFKSLEWMVRGSARSARQLTQVREFLRSRICRRSALRAHFADSVAASEDPGAEARCGLCDICARETSFTERVY